MGKKVEVSPFQRLFIVKASFEQELIQLLGGGFVPLSTQPNVVNPNISALLILKFHKDLSSAQFKVYVCGASKNPQKFVLAVHLHRGEADVNGPVIATLFNSPSSHGTPVNGLLAKGTLTNYNIQVDSGINSVASLYQAIRRGAVYINVHTVDLPDGAVRGQIVSEC